MTQAVIVSAVRTAIGTSRKGTLSETSGEELATFILEEAIKAAGIDGNDVDDVIFGEAMYGGGDLARYAAVSAGLQDVSGQAVNRHCASSLAALGDAAASIIAGMEDVVVAGGVQAGSTAPISSWRVAGTEDEYERRIPPTFPPTAEATDDVGLTVGWMVVNIPAVGGNFDPYPFVFFNLLLAVLVALQGPLIVMSQNRQTLKDRATAETDFKVNLKNEVNIETILRELGELRGETAARFERIEKVVGVSER